MEVDVKWLCLLLTTLAGRYWKSAGRNRRQRLKTVQYRPYTQPLTIEIDHKVQTAADSIGASALEQGCSSYCTDKVIVDVQKSFGRMMFAVG